ncbi:MAG TPA: hypothetical protein V6D47_01360 [Oscillatoriaceae cyanobacterium]
MPEKKPQTNPLAPQPAAPPTTPPAQKIATLGDFSRVLESLPKADETNE